MNPTRSFPTALPQHETHGAQAVCERSAAGTPRGPARKRGLLTAAALCALCCVALAGCDGSSNGSSSSSGGSGSSSSGSGSSSGGGGDSGGGAFAPWLLTALAGLAWRRRYLPSR